MIQVLSLAAAAVLLCAYAANQTGRLPTTNPLYSWLNLVTTAILAYVAFWSTSGLRPAGGGVVGDERRGARPATEDGLTGD